MHKCEYCRRLGTIVAGGVLSRVEGMGILVTPDDLLPLNRKAMSATTQRAPRSAPSISANDCAFANLPFAIIQQWGDSINNLQTEHASV